MPSFHDYFDSTLNYSRDDDPPGTDHVKTSFPSSITKDSSVSRGPNLVGWRQLIIDGLGATTNLVGSRQFVKQRHCYGDYYRLNDLRSTLPAFPPGWKTRYHMDGTSMLPGASAAPAADLIEADNQAQISFKKACRSAQTAEQGGVFAGEVLKTIHGLRHPAEALTQVMKSSIDLFKVRRISMYNLLRHGNYRQVNHLAGLSGDVRNLGRIKQGVVSKTWLEVQFHWIPLISDINQSAQAFRRISTNHYDSQRINGGGAHLTSGEETNVTDSRCGHPFILNYKRQATEEWNSRYLGAVRTTSGTSSLCDAVTGGELGRQLGFNVSNFAPTVYNLIPFTFVADYFSNLGDVIDAYSFPSSDVVWAQRTLRKKNSDFTTSPAFVTPPSDIDTQWVSGYMDPGFMATQLVTTSRSAFDPGGFVPSFRFKVPGVGSIKWLNIAALGHALSQITPF